MRKKILILGHNYATQFIDIFNQYTALFDQTKYEVTVAYLTGAMDETVKSRTIAEHTLFLDLNKKDIRTTKIPAIKRLLTLCRENNYDMVICHRYKPTYIMLWVAQFIRIAALIFVMHELATMSSFARQFLTRCLLRKNMWLAGVSNAVRDDMRKSLWSVPKERIVTLYNMIDIEQTEPYILTKDKARSQLQLDKDDFVFGHIARLATNKDQVNLIKAFALMKPYCSKAKLVLIGDGDLEVTLKQQVKDLKLQNEIIFTGFLSQAYQYMKAFDCFVLPSKQEAFGRVLLEAMIAKLPIIAARVNGIPEVIGSSGTLVNPQDPIMLAAAMKKIYILSDEERDAIGHKAYQNVSDNFSIPKFHEQFWQMPLVQGLIE